MIIKEKSEIKNIAGLPGFLILMTVYLFIQAGEIRTMQAMFVIAIFLWIEKSIGGNNGGHISEAVIFMLFFLWVINNRLFTFFNEPYNRWIYTVFTIASSIYVYRHGLVTDGGTDRKEEVIRLVFHILLVVCFFGFQIRNSIGSSHPCAGLLLGLLFYRWCAVFYRTSVWLAGWALNKRDALLRQDTDSDNVKNTRFVWGTLFIAVCSVGLIMSVFYYPGIISPDSFFNYRCALEFSDLSLRTDIHSFGYVLLTKLLLFVNCSYYTLTISMVLGFAAVWASYWTYLYRKGFKFQIVFLITVIWLSFPGNAYLLICSWKDIPFSVSMLLASYMLTRYCIEKDFCGRPLNLFIFAISLFGVSIFRSNGQVVLLFVFGALFIGWLRRKINRKMMLTALSSIILLFLFKGPFFSLLQVQQSPPGFATLPFIDGIWENLYSGQEVSDDVIKFVEEEIMPADEFTASYEENYTNIYVFPGGYGDIDFNKAKNAYLWCLKHHPYTTLLARLKRTYNIWSVFPNEIYPVATNYYGKIRDYSSLNEAYSWKFADRFEWFRKRVDFVFREDYLIGAIQFFVSRCGWNFVLWGISAMILMRIKRGKYLLIILPAFANMAGLFLGCCFPDIRYFYPMFLLTVPYLAVLYLVFANDNSVQKESPKKS